VNCPCVWSETFSIFTPWKHGGRGNTAPLFLCLSTRLKSVVSFPPSPLYPPGKIPANHRIGGCFPSSKNAVVGQAASSLFTILTELSQFHARRWNIHCKQGTDVGHSGFTAFALDLVTTCHSDTNSQNCPDIFFAYMVFPYGFQTPAAEVHALGWMPFSSLPVASPITWKEIKRYDDLMLWLLEFSVSRFLNCCKK